MTNDITFFRRFQDDIISGRKTITLRDASESHFVEGQYLRTGCYEDDVYFCTIKIISVTAVRLCELDDNHARQENMTLTQLKKVINEIYPNEESLWEIAFNVVTVAASAG